MKTMVVLGMLAALCIPLSYAEARGEQLYETYCSQCHGLNGAGGGINVPDMAVQPRDHTDTAEMSARTDEELAKAIREGGKAVNKSVLMPAWDNNLSDRQIDDLVVHLRHLCCEQ